MLKDIKLCTGAHKTTKNIHGITDIIQAAGLPQNHRIIRIGKEPLRPFSPTMELESSLHLHIDSVEVVGFSGQHPE